VAVTPGKVVAVEGASAAGKTTAIEEAGRRTGWVALPEAFRRLTPTPRLEFGSPDELLTLEEQLLREDARRYTEAREQANAGRTVLADTGFLGPLTYTEVLVRRGEAPRTVLAHLIEIARALTLRGAWGVADAYIYIDTSPGVRSFRGRVDPGGAPASLARRHLEVGDAERSFYRDRFAPVLSTRFGTIPGDGSRAEVAQRLVDAVEASVASPTPVGLVHAVLVLFDEPTGRSPAARGNR
jgi:hypothetical protein